jgi:hypothetical protein
MLNKLLTSAGVAVTAGTLAFGGTAEAATSGWHRSPTGLTGVNYWNGFLQTSGHRVTAYGFNSTSFTGLNVRSKLWIDGHLVMDVKHYSHEFNYGLGDSANKTAVLDTTVCASVCDTERISLRW